MNRRNALGLLILSMNSLYSAVLEDKVAQNIESKNIKEVSRDQAVALFLCNYDNGSEEKYSEEFLDSPDFEVYFEALFEDQYFIKDRFC